MKIFHPNSIYKDIPFPAKVKIADTIKQQIPEIPVLPNLNFTAKFGNKFSNDDLITSAFNSNASCAIALDLFRWLDITPNQQAAFPLKTNFSLTSGRSDVLFSATIDAIRHPPCIVNAASEYVQKVFSSQKYIGVHWRYDKDDFGKVVCKESWAKYYCDNMHKIQPKTVALAIHNATDITKKSIPIYIASPPSLKVFVSKVYEELKQLNKNFVKPSLKLNDFLSSKYSNCWEETGWTNIENIVSLCEMEIMIKSFWFFFSAGSTWSQMILPFRTDTYDNGTIVKRFEANIFDFAVVANAAIINGAEAL